mmetsp:Transcript_13720/g.32723  ORF Transcript_13720/g.32723 Transcript_13720/m.32723 type:complete len:236 (-) Transcript_13720:199-906(-)
MEGGTPAGPSTAPCLFRSLPSSTHLRRRDSLTSDLKRPGWQCAGLARTVPATRNSAHSSRSRSPGSSPRHPAGSGLPSSARSRTLATQVWTSRLRGRASASTAPSAALAGVEPLEPLLPKRWPWPPSPHVQPLQHRLDPCVARRPTWAVGVLASSCSRALPRALRQLLQSRSGSGSDTGLPSGRRIQGSSANPRGGLRLLRRRGRSWKWKDRAHMRSARTRVGSPWTDPTDRAAC